MDRTEALRVAGSTGWLSRQPESFRERLLDQAMLIRYAPGQPVYHLGDGLGGFFCAVRGTFGIYVSTPDGGPVLADLQRAVSWFGFGPLFRGGDRSMGFKAFEPSAALHVSLSAINRMIAADPEADRRIATLGYVNAERMVGASTDLLIRRGDRRIAAVLLRLRGALDGAPETDELRLSQADLGEMANASRHLVNRTLARFERRGWIAIGYGRVAIRDAAALAAMAAGEAGEEDPAEWGGAPAARAAAS